MLGSYLPILIMMLVSSLLALGMVVGSFFLGPKKPNPFKRSAYECGMTPVGSAHERFPVKFYLIAMLFIIFDIETIFLYPWAVVFKTAAGGRADKIFLLGEMAVFVGILFVGYAYIWKKGALDWDTGQADGVRPDRAIRAPRPPIRFGNENSGPVNLSADATATVVVQPGTGDRAA